MVWVNRIGVITLVLGVAFFFKYAVDNRWIGETGRVVLGILAGYSHSAARTGLGGAIRRLRSGNLWSGNRHPVCLVLCGVRVLPSCSAAAGFHANGVKYSRGGHAGTALRLSRDRRAGTGWRIPHTGGAEHGRRPAVGISQLCPVDQRRRNGDCAAAELACSRSARISGRYGSLLLLAGGVPHQRQAAATIFALAFYALFLSGRLAVGAGVPGGGLIELLSRLHAARYQIFSAGGRCLVAALAVCGLARIGAKCPS